MSCWCGRLYLFGSRKNGAFGSVLSFEPGEEYRTKRGVSYKKFNMTGYSVGK